MRSIRVQRERESIGVRIIPQLGKMKKLGSFIC